jgi:hypothetical protein
MPAQVGALDALVMLVAILVGLALGALVAWASLLLRTGHPSRPMPGGMDVRAASGGEDSAVPPVAVAATTIYLIVLPLCLLIPLVPSVLDWLGIGDFGRTAPMAIGLAAFLVGVLTAAIERSKGAGR